MGYTQYEIRIPLWLSSHNSEQDRIDRKAMEDLHMEIEALIESTPAYKRIATIGIL